MSLSNYGALKTSVAAWINRTDLDTVIPDFVALAEQDIRVDCRVQNMEQLATGTLTGETLAHPTRFLEARRLVVGTSVYEFVSADLYQDYSTSTRKIFTSIGQSLYILNGAAGDSYSLIYYAGFAPFDADADTNWLLENAPDVYLAGACRYGSAYLKDDAGEQRFATRYVGAVSRLNGQQARGAVAGPMRIRLA